MMEKLSGATNSWVWKSIFALITASFVLSGVGGYLISSTDTSAATVNGEKISQAAFQQAYEQQNQRLGQQLGNKFDSLMDSPQFVNQVREGVVNELINQELMRQYQQKLGVVVGDKQIKKAIVEQSVFQKGGKFDNNLYQELLHRNNLTPDAYAAQVAQELEASQLEQGILGTDFVLPQQKQELAKLLFQKRNVRVATLSMVNALAKQQVSKHEIANYYNMHKSAFKVPELVKVAYVDISKANIEKTINVTDVQVSQYYQDNKNEFSSSNEQHLAMIEVAGKSSADLIYNQLEQGADFATLAKSESIDRLTAKNGGDLSWVTKGALPPKFEKVALQTRTGQFSKPFLLDNKYYIVKVLGERGGNAVPLSEVANQIRSKIKQEQVIATFYKLEKEASEKAFEHQESLLAAAKVIDSPVMKTALFPKDNVPAVLNFSNVIYNIFDTDLLQGDDNSNAINVGELHSIIVRVLEHKPARTLTLAEATPEISKLLKQQQAEQQLSSSAQFIVKTLSNKDTKALPNGVVFTLAKEFVYATTTDLKLRKAIFSMKEPAKGDVSYGSVITDNGQVVILELLNVQDGSLSQAEEQRLSTNFLSAKQTTAFNQLLVSLRTQAKIKINKSFIEQSTH